jgi:hypothetical protein
VKTNVTSSSSTRSTLNLSTTSAFTTNSIFTSKINCNFDQNTICEWQNSDTGDFNWKTQIGASQSLLTGPLLDHTTGSETGGYALIDALSGQKLKESAVIFSPFVNNTLSQGACFKFYYHMYGCDVNALHVYTQSKKSDTRMKLWQRRGNKGNKWILGYINIEPSDFDIRFLIEATVKSLK